MEIPVVDYPSSVLQLAWTREVSCSSGSYLSFVRNSVHVYLLRLNKDPYLLICFEQKDLEHLSTIVYIWAASTTPNCLPAKKTQNPHPLRIY
jgi:hypothetical protein